MLIGCDTLVALGSATHRGQTLLAKNSDRPPSEAQPLVAHPARTHPAGGVVRCQFLSVPQVAETYAHVGSRPYWCWGYEHGFNEHQVVIGNEALPSRLPEAQEPRLVGMELIRLGLERSRTAAQAVEVMTDLVGRFGQGKFANQAGVRTYDNGYIVADPREAYILETAGHDWAVRRAEGALGISNIYSIGCGWDRISPTAADLARESGWWDGRDRLDFAAAFADPAAAEGSGFWRRRRSCGLTAREPGALDARTMVAILQDHGDGRAAGEPLQSEIPMDRPSICMHHQADGSGGNTAASLVADLCADGSRLPVYWCSFYSPCLGLFIPLFLEGEIPAVLAVGGEQESPESPWWRFHRLSRAVRLDPQANAVRVRERWSPMQAALFESAYGVAGEARRQLDAGDASGARQLLTDYMDAAVTGMMETVDQLLQTLSTPQVAAGADERICRGPCDPGGMSLEMGRKRSSGNGFA